jgi:ribonuclease-3
MLNNFIDRVKLLFRKDRELYFSLYPIIGFYPHDISYYKMALMHKSIMHRNNKGKPVNNERLEFLGDAILDAAVGDIVYRHFPGKREGFLTNTRSKLVQRDTLNKLAQEMGLGDLILSSGHSSSHNSYMGGNAFEALVGAIYLDRGYDACMKFMKKRILAQMINIDKVAYKEVNFKSKLIEWSQKNKVQIEFKLLKQGTDKNGSPMFNFQAVLEGVEGCSGEGFSKKESQQLAAKLTLEQLKKEPQFIDKVFAAKADRTKMEEEPIENVPDTEEKTDFIISQDETAEPVEKHETAFKEEVFDEAQSATDERHEPIKESDDKEAAKDDEFDLSDISAKTKDREDIIAMAEAAAFSDSEA